MTKKFRLQGKKLFLTYSQTEGLKEDLLKFLTEKLTGLNQYIIAKEKHKDGGSHFHCYVETNKKVNITNPNYLDWNKNHPKLEKCKDEFKVKSYCKKDGDYITNMSFCLYYRMRELAKIGKWQEGLKLIINENPKEIYRLDKWENNLKKVCQIFAQKTQKTKYNSNDFIKINLNWNKKSKALILSGRSGIGKTQYAKTLFSNPLICRHIDKLKQFKYYEHDGIIFDDMNFSHYPRESCIHLVDLEEDSDINVKCGMITIPAETPRVFTTNRDPQDIFSSFDTAIKRRITIKVFKKDIRKK